MPHVTPKNMGEAFPQVSERDLRDLIRVLDQAEVKVLPDEEGIVPTVDEAMEFADKILGGFGVEAVQPEDAYVDRYWMNTVALYVNFGDTYDTTLLYDTENAEFFIGSWGDFVEQWEQEHAEEEEVEEDL